VYLGNGDGTFQRHISYRLPGFANLSAPPLAVGDFNGDGKLDIAVDNANSGATRFVSVLLGNGDGTFQAPYSDIVVGGDQIAAGDFTGDGRSGIVTSAGDLLLPAPADFSLSGASVAEQQPAGTLVGTFNTPNDDPNNFFVYTFVSGTGGDDNADFTIDAQGNLHTAASFDYATRSSYSIRVRSTDAVGDISEQVITIQVLPLQETVLPPTLPGATLNVPYSQTITAAQAGYAGPFTFSVTAGSLPAGLSLSAGGTLIGMPTAAGSYSFTVTATENNGTMASQAYTVAMSPYVAPATPAQLVAVLDAANQTGIATTITLAAGATFDFTHPDNFSDGVNALPVITGTVTILGNNDTIERTGSAGFRLFDVAAGGSLTLEGLTLTGGWAWGAGAGAEGGAIYSAGTLSLTGTGREASSAELGIAAGNYNYASGSYAGGGSAQATVAANANGRALPAPLTITSATPRLPTTTAIATRPLIPPPSGGVPSAAIIDANEALSARNKRCVQSVEEASNIRKELPLLRSGERHIEKVNVIIARHQSSTFLLQSVSRCNADAEWELSHNSFWGRLGRLIHSSDPRIPELAGSA
jgi:hypothetical protein